MADKKILTLEILAPDKVIFKGDIQHLSSTNQNGNFDMLPDHIPFVSLIRSYIDLLTVDNKKISYKINTAVLHCKDNFVTIFTDIQSISSTH